MRSIVLGAVAVLSAAALTACGTPGASPAPARLELVAAKKTTSDLSQLTKLGIVVRKSVLIDVADDGVDRWLEVGRKGVDFTGTKRTDTTMMSLQPAPVKARNRVLIKPPFWNEDLGDGYCVADTKGAPLKLEVCKPGRATQIWTVVPAGDSGQFELKGRYGILRVHKGKLVTGGPGRTGLQTITYAR